MDLKEAILRKERLQRGASDARARAGREVAELDYLLSRHAGSAAQTALLDEVARGAYQLEPFTAADVAAAKGVLARYPRLQIGLADASLVVLAERHRTRDILTLDERRFRTLRVRARKRFRLLPLDR